MEKIVTKSAGSPAREFVIPIGLLKSFTTDLRLKSKLEPINGYITFDMQMLVSVLRDKDVTRARELAAELEKFGKLGGDLVIMQR